MRLGFTQSRFAIGYIALGMVALAMFAVLLWYGYRTNLGTFRAYVPGAEMQRLVEIFHRDGARATAEAIDAYLPSLPRDELILFVDGEKQRLAGSLPAWPSELPEVPGTYGLVIGTGGAAAPMRVVTSHVTLPGGYYLLMGRESVRFQSLVERFWYGIVAAMVAVLALGALIARRSRRALVADEQRFTLAVAGAKDGVWDWDLSSGMIYISPRGQKILTGRAADGGDVRHADEWARHYRLHPDDEPRRKAAVREHLAGRTPHYEGEWRVLHPDGTYHWVHSRGVCMRDASGRAVRFAGSSTDIDERKRGELALAESEARFRSLTELSSDFFWETDAEHRYTAIELGWAYTGVRNNASKLGLARWDIPYASPDEVAWAAHRAAIAGRERFVGFRFSRFEEGEERFYEHSGEPRYDAQGNFLGYRGVGRDVTERVRAEEALRESEKRYERVMLAAEAGFWDWDVPADEFYVSPKLLEMTDFPPGTRFAGRADFMTRAPFHPDDRTKWERAVKALFASGGTRLAMEIRSLHGAETRWAILSGMCVRDAAGKILRWTGSATDITERKRMEASLTQSEERYARVMQASEDGFWEWIVATDEFYASPRMLALYGLPPDTVFRSRADFLSRFPFHPEDLALWRNAVAAHLAGQSARVDVEVRANVQRGTRWIHLTAICLRDAAGAEERWTGSVSDVTARRRAQEALHRSEERYAHAMEGSDAGHWDWNIVSDEMFVSERAREMLALPAGPLPARRADIMELVPMHPEDRAAMADVVKAGIESGIHERDYRVIPRAGEVRWLRSRGKIYKDARGAAVRMTGSLIDITERKLAADALRASEERYSLAMDASEEGHFDLDIESGELFISERLNEIYGFPPGTRFAHRDEYLAKVRLHRDDAEKYHAALAAAVAKDGPPRYEFEFRIVQPSGEVRWLRTRGKVARDAEGRAHRRTGVVADITETKRAEEALRESQERYERAMEATAAGHWEWDLVTHQVFHSPRFRELYGISPEETFADRDAWKARQPLSASERERQERALQAAIADPTKTYDIELSFELRPGEVRWLRSRGKVFRAEDGRPLRVTGATTDITPQKLAQEALRESQERYALAVAGSDDGVWDVDFSARRVFVSARGRELAGMPPGPEIMSMEDFFAGLPLHPEDVERRNTAFQAHLAGEIPAYVGEFRLRQPDGVYRWRRLRGLCVRDANGKPQRMAGSISDIDARKRAEESLRMSEERYALAMEAAGDGHTDWNLVSGEFYVSPRLLEILGYAPETTFADRADWVRRFPFHPQDRPKWEAAIAEHFAGREAKFRMDLRIVVNSETRWVAFTFIATRDAAGKPVRWTGSIADINDAKLAEEARQLSEERYALAMRASGAGHWDWKIASDEFYASPRYLEFGGFPADLKYSRRDDIVSRIPFHPDDKVQYEAAVAAHFAGQTPRVDMVVRVVPHGQTRWLHVIGTCLRDSDGKPVRWAGSVTDISARKLAEEALQLSEKRYALAMEVAEEGHFDWNVQTDEIFASARALSVIGAPPQARYRTRTDVIARVRYHPDDDDRIRREWRAALDGQGVDHEFEYRILRGKAQEPRWIRGRWKVFRDEAGVALRVIGVIADITERKFAADELRRSEARFRALTGISSDWYWRQDENLRFTYLSEGVSERAGWSGEVYIGRLRWEVPDIHLISCSWEEHKEVLAKRQPFRDLEYWRPGKDGRMVYSSISGAPIFDEQGNFEGYHGTGRNITERKRIEEELRRSEARFRSLVELSSDWYWTQDENLRFVSYVPPDVGSRSGVSAASSLGKTRWEFDDVKPLSSTWEEHRALLAARQPFRDFEYVRIDENGTPHYTVISGVPLFDSQGRFTGYHGVGRNVSERRRFEAELRSRQEMLDLAQKSARVTAFEWKIGAGEGENRWSPDLEAMYGLEPGTYDGTFESWQKLVHPEDWPAIMEALREAQRTGDVAAEYRVVHRDASMHWLQAKGRMFFDAAGKPARMVGFMHDVTERKRVEEALRQSEERYALAVAGSNEGIFDWDLVSDRVYVSHRAQELFGLPHGELWRPRRDWRHILTFHPEDAPRLHDCIKAHIEGSTPTYDVEFRIVVPNGVRWYRQRGIALRDASGKAYRVVGSIGDVTEQHIVGEELKAMERKLRLAQRLEAMGTLAGGIAHDFNNILGAILGYGEMAMRDAAKGSRLRRDLDSIVAAGERGRALVDRVLAFSRSGVGERVPVHVEKVVREALDLVSAKLPPDVTLHAKLHAGAAAMLGDATQVHQVLMNLASNAIQAMPAGGTLRVSLRLVRLEAARAPTIGILDPGDYLALEVADTGTGIAPEILDRIFDPFFTTKEVGTGTGLGLSLVHGIVAEVGGAIDVASRPGAGSTLTVYLPRTGDAEDSSQREEPELPRGEGQRVLVVDDEEPLVKLATRTLQELGYAPVGFTSSTAALAAFRADPERFDALITDERMPGMSGSALIREVRGISGRIPIVLMSGYVGGAVATRAREAGAEEVLKKPLSARDLAASLARVLHP